MTEKTSWRMFRDHQMVMGQIHLYLSEKLAPTQVKWPTNTSSILCGVASKYLKRVIKPGLAALVEPWGCQITFTEQEDSSDILVRVFIS